MPAAHLSKSYQDSFRRLSLTECSTYLTWNWSFSLTLDSISTGGGLQITIADVNISDPVETWDEGGTQSHPTAIIDTIKSAVGPMRTAITDYEQTVRDVLKNQGTFIFPGSGTFQLSQPTFNNNGDLLVDVDYLPPTSQ